MAKKKTTIYIDEDLLRSARVMAARTGAKDYEVFEEALRSYLGVDALDRALNGASLTSEEAIDLAVEEIRHYRSGQ